MVKDDELHGMIFFHNGDDSEFVAMNWMWMSRVRLGSGASDQPLTVGHGNKAAERAGTYWTFPGDVCLDGGWSKN
jgi:hypothetical protein